MDREVSKEQQARHIYDGTLMRFSIRAYSKLMLQAWRRTGGSFVRNLLK
jgi:hypothetical protein